MFVSAWEEMRCRFIGCSYSVLCLLVCARVRVPLGVCGMTKLFVLSMLVSVYWTRSIGLLKFIASPLPQPPVRLPTPPSKRWLIHIHCYIIHFCVSGDTLAQCSLGTFWLLKSSVLLVKPTVAMLQRSAEYVSGSEWSMHWPWALL